MVDELEPGDYVVVSAVDRDAVMDVYDGSSADGANVRAFTGNMTPAQVWSVSRDADSGLYTLVNAGSGKALDVSGGNACDRSNVQRYSRNGTAAQLWRIVWTAEGYKLVSSIDGRYVLDLFDADPEPGTNLQLFSDNGTLAQRFLFYSALAKAAPGSRLLDDGTYTVSFGQAGDALDVARASIYPRANVQSFEANGTGAQAWRFEYDGEGYYTVANEGTGLYLDLDCGSVVPGANLQGYSGVGTDTQKWALRALEGGGYGLFCKAGGLALGLDGTNAVGAVSPAALSIAPSDYSVADGPYAITYTVSPKTLVIDVPGGFCSEGDGVQAFEANGTMAQKFYLERADGGSYVVRSFVYGMDLTDDGDGVVSLRLGDGTARQRWRLAFSRGGWEFVNEGTGMALDVTGGALASGTPLQSFAPNGTAAQRFVLAPTPMIAPGALSISNARSRMFLDVVDGSWGDRANVQQWYGNGTNAQKFFVAEAGDGYYTVKMALSGKVLDVSDMSAEDRANVQIYAPDGLDAQLWSIRLVDGGLVFTNKASGKVLDVFDGSLGAGANVQQFSYNGTLAQLFSLNSTPINTGDVVSMRHCLDRIGASWGYSSFGGDYAMSPGLWSQFVNALQFIWDDGGDVSLVMMDLETGQGVSYNADRVNYGASVMKAAYCTWITQTYLDTGILSFYDLQYDLEQACVVSDDDIYQALRYRFGSSGFDAWLREGGVYGYGYEAYPFITARDLATIWLHINSYLVSDAPYVWFMDSITSHGDLSSIYESLGSYRKVNAKPGWLHPYDGSGYNAFNDSGIVVGSNGNRYLLTTLTSVNYYTQSWDVRHLAYVMDLVHEEMCS